MDKVEEGKIVLEKEFSYFNQHSVQQILNLFLKEKKDIKPVFDLHYIARYPEIEYVTDLNPNEILNVLDRLTLMQTIESHYYERIPICDKCSSANILPKFLCAHCKSTSIAKHRLIRHIACGYSDLEDKFQKQNNGMASCPRCNALLRLTPSSEVRINNNMFYCKECSKNYFVPLSVFACRECDNSMTTGDVEFTNIYSYTLNEKSLQVSPIVMLEPLRKMLEEIGLIVESPGNIKGKSTQNHKFDIVCQKNDKKIVAINVVYSNIIVNESNVVELFAASFDCNVDLSILVAVPEVTVAAENLAKQYGITIIQGKDGNSLSQKLKKTILSV